MTRFEWNLLDRLDKLSDRIGSEGANCEAERLQEEMDAARGELGESFGEGKLWIDEADSSERDDAAGAYHFYDAKGNTVGTIQLVDSEEGRWSKPGADLEALERLKNVAAALEDMRQAVAEVVGILEERGKADLGLSPRN